MIAPRGDRLADLRRLAQRRCSTAERDYARARIDLQRAGDAKTAAQVALAQAKVDFESKRVANVAGLLASRVDATRFARAGLQYQILESELAAFVTATAESVAFEERAARECEAKRAAYAAARRREEKLESLVAPRRAG